MKKNYNVIISALLMAGAANLHAIGDLQISLQGTNVVLSWASTNSDYYLVQYSTNLHSSHPWQTLTNWMPGSDGTNTVFVHSGAFQIPTASPSSLGYNDLLSAQTLNQEEIPLAMRADDPNSAAPFFLYPPGFDFSGFLLYDPETQTWHSGNGFTRDNPPDPLTPGTNTNSTVTMPVMRFYRVGRNGVYLSGLTNGTTLSGTVSIPLEVVGVEGETVAGVSLFDNGSLIKVINITSNSIPDHVDLDTTRLGNGVHNITAWIECIWDDSNETNYVQMSSESSPVSLNTSNEISFPDWMDDFGEIEQRLMIRAQTIYTNHPVLIDIRGSQGTILQSFFTYASSGVMDIPWPNLGNSYLGTNYYTEPYFSISLNILEENRTGEQSENQFILETNGHVLTKELTAEEAQQYHNNRSVLASAEKTTHRRIDSWSTNGMWVVAYQPVSNLPLTEYDQANAVLYLRNSIHDSGFDVYPSYNTPDDLFILNSVSRAIELKAALNLNKCRNFFYFGHAASGWIGKGSNKITAEEITDLLHTDTHNCHAYRFVFLYGCSSAKGPLVEAFGVPHKKMGTSDFLVNGMRPKTFVGLKNNHIADTVDAKFIKNFIDYWGDTTSITNALKFAAEDPNMPENNNILDIFEIYGAENLTYKGCNN